MKVYIKKDGKDVQLKSAHQVSTECNVSSSAIHQACTRPQKKKNGETALTGIFPFQAGDKEGPLMIVCDAKYREYKKERVV